jgi:hypothetical protein
LVFQSLPHILLMLNERAFLSPLAHTLLSVVSIVSFSACLFTHQGIILVCLMAVAAIVSPYSRVRRVWINLSSGVYAAEHFLGPCCCSYVNRSVRALSLGRFVVSSNRRCLSSSSSSSSCSSRTRIRSDFIHPEWLLSYCRSLRRRAVRDGAAAANHEHGAAA